MPSKLSYEITCKVLEKLIDTYLNHINDENTEKPKVDINKMSSSDELFVALEQYKYGTRCQWYGHVVFSQRGLNHCSSHMLIYVQTCLKTKTQQNTGLLSYHIISYHTISYHIIPYHTISYHISYIIYHISYIIYHISYIIYHISYIINHISYIIYHISYHHIIISSYQMSRNQKF